MWPEDDEVDAALRGDFPVDPDQDVNWPSIIAGAAVLTLLAVFAVSCVLYFAPI